MKIDKHLIMAKLSSLTAIMQDEPKAFETLMLIKELITDQQKEIEELKKFKKKADDKIFDFCMSEAKLEEENQQLKESNQELRQQVVHKDSALTSYCADLTKSEERVKELEGRIKEIIKTFEQVIKEWRFRFNSKQDRGELRALKELTKMLKELLTTKNS